MSMSEPHGTVTIQDESQAQQLLSSVTVTVVALLAAFVGLLTLPFVIMADKRFVRKHANMVGS